MKTLMAAWFVGAALYAAAEPPAANRPTATLTHELKNADEEALLHAKERRLAEPKDAKWSPAMEQRVERYIVAHPQGRKFELVKVDCRTTFCAIAATGADDAAFAVFQRVLWDMLDQPWDTFERHLDGVDSKRVSGMLEFEVVLTRRGGAKPAR